MAPRPSSAFRRASLAASPAIAACAFAFALVLPFKLVGGCGPLPPPWWAYAPALILLLLGALLLVIGRVRWSLRGRDLLPGVVSWAIAAAVLLLPEINVFSIITTC